MEDKKLQDDLNNDIENSSNEGEEKEKKQEGSGIFTTDGKELPKVDGGYTIYNPGGSLGDNRITSKD